MEYGLIGEHLGHSFSKDIHEKLSPSHYELREIAREELDYSYSDEKIYYFIPTN